MSAGSLSVILTPEAQDDFEDIIAWTRREWGDAQAGKYGDAIYHALARLAEFPMIGKRRDALRRGLRSVRAERHLIYYQIEPEVIRVIRILHERMDAAAHISP